VHQTKTGKVRRVPLTPALQRDLKNRVGNLVPYSETACGAFASYAKKLSGVAGFHAHRMRHTFACQWLESGGSLAALQQILGHSTIATTQRYARLSDESVVAEARRLSGQL
jgi:integrase